MGFKNKMSSSDSSDSDSYSSSDSSNTDSSNISNSDKLIHEKYKKYRELLKLTRQAYREYIEYKQRYSPSLLDCSDSDSENDLPIGVTCSKEEEDEVVMVPLPKGGLCPIRVTCSNEEEEEDEVIMAPLPKGRLCPKCKYIRQSPIEIGGKVEYIDEQLIPLIQRLNSTELGTITKGCHALGRTKEECRIQCYWIEYSRLLNLIFRKSSNLNEGEPTLYNFIWDPKRFETQVLPWSPEDGIRVYIYMKHEDVDYFCDLWDKVFST